MSYPKCFSNQPTAMLAEEGKTYAWCTCGISDKNPLCDGKHKEIENESFKSLKFTVETTQEVWLCNCKQTKNPPYCDGSHNQLNS